VLIDPDNAPVDDLAETAKAAEEGGAAVILVGGSMLINEAFDHVIQIIKTESDIPVIIFPGNSRQLSKYADGILFMSLLSGRNPQYLIGEQIHAAPIIRRMDLPAVSTCYLLIESGRTTSAEFVSDTRPIPRHKKSIAVAHAQAAELFGFATVYLEAGSGAEFPVPAEMIKAVTESVSVPVIVGGGITNAEQAATAAKSGAAAVVVGTVIERKGISVIDEIAGYLKEITS